MLLKYTLCDRQKKQTNILVTRKEYFIYLLFSNFQTFKKMRRREVH